jgi:hypothetical protein
LKAFLLASLGLLLASACTQVLDIQDARVDASLSGGGHGGTSSGSGNTGGSTGTSGSLLSSSNGGETDQPTTGGHAATSGGKSNGGSKASGGEGGASEPMTPTLCESYCDKVTTNCKDKYEQYRTFDQCIEVCKLLPPGAEGDENVNTTQCRMRQADFAESEPFVYCKSAGPLGAGKCGSNCISFCSLMQAECTKASTATNLEPSYYDSSQACLEACGAIPTHENDPKEYSSSATANPSCFVGNTIYCRTYHVAAGIEQGTPDEHCPHAMGGDPCIDQ